MAFARPAAALVATLALTTLSGCFSVLPDPVVSARDAEYMALIPQAEIDPHFARYKMKNPTGERPGTIVVDTMARQLYLVLPGGERRVPNRLRGPEGGVAVRWTPHPALSRLIRAYGEPITSTSANRPGVPPAMRAGEILTQWPDAIARGTLRVLDGGLIPDSPPSTVVDCVGRRPRVIRPGAISAEVLRRSVPDLVGDA